MTAPRRRNRSGDPFCLFTVKGPFQPELKPAIPTDASGSTLQGALGPRLHVTTRARQGGGGRAGAPSSWACQTVPQAGHGPLPGCRLDSGGWRRRAPSAVTAGVSWSGAQMSVLPAPRLGPRSPVQDPRGGPALGDQRQSARGVASGGDFTQHGRAGPSVRISAQRPRVRARTRRRVSLFSLSVLQRQIPGASF